MEGGGGREQDDLDIIQPIEEGHTQAVCVLRPNESGLVKLHVTHLIIHSEKEPN